MSRCLATAASEFRIALRNRWVGIAASLMIVFALGTSMPDSMIVVATSTLKRWR